jgi:hypothetical protein
MRDVYQQFAEECGLRMSTEPLSVAPRNVLAPVHAVEQHFLVDLSRSEGGRGSVRLVFAVPLTQQSVPAMRDVLWWLAGDAWVIEQQDRSPQLWATAFGYEPESDLTLQLFEHYARQTRAFKVL